MTLAVERLCEDAGRATSAAPPLTRHAPPARIGGYSEAGSQLARPSRLPTEAEAQVATTTFFAGVDARVSQQLAMSFEIRCVERGEPLTGGSRQRRAPGLGIVLAGQGRTLWNSIDGARSSMELLLPGDYFGSRVELAAGATTETPRAGTETRIATLNVQTFDELVRSSPEFSGLVTHGQALKLAQLRSCYNDLAFLDTGARLAKLLLRLERAYGKRLADRVYVDHSLNQSELGQVIYASRESVSKLVTEFDNRGWISVNGRSFVVVDRAALRRRQLR